MYRLRLGTYAGNAGNSLYANGTPFSTKDRDNDSWGSNCAGNWNGAWWMTNCHGSHLNGLNYGTSDIVPYAQGIVWGGFTPYSQTDQRVLKEDVMAIRPL